MSTLESRKKITAWQQEAEKHAPKPGDIAPDFELPELDGETTIRLSDYRGKRPVALVFGSYTWPPFADGTVRLADLYQKYQHDVQFLMIYIREAHPVDGWWLGKGLFKWALDIKKSKAALDIYDPQTTEERLKVAQRCADTLDYGIPTLVDGVDDAVNTQYAGLPTRLYLVGLNGKVMYAGGLGPWGFKPAELDKAIASCLSGIAGH